MKSGVLENTVDISLNTLIRECRTTRILPEDLFMMFRSTNRENIHEVFKYKKFNDDFTDKLSCFNDGSFIVGYIKPSYNEFLDKLLTILNIKHNSKTKDDENLTKKMLDRIEVLKGIADINQLRIEFPILYKDLVDGRKYLDSLKKMKKQEQISEDKFADGEHYIYSCAFKPSLRNFIITQSEMYRRYATDRSKLKERLENKSYNNFIRTNFDQNKLCMLVVHEYIVKCENSNDIEMIKEYIEIIEKYLKSSYDKNVYIILDNGMKVDINNIKLRLDNLKRRVKDNSSVVEWILVPEGRGYDKVHKEEESKETIMTYEEIEKLKSIGEAKTAFYESTPYICKAIGLRKYRGYVAYIYPNGKVILDREFNRDTPSTAKDNAYYIMDASDFIRYSGDDKQTLRKNPNVLHHNHSKKWIERATQYIEMETSEEEKQQAVQLVKRLKEKSM